MPPSATKRPFTNATAPGQESRGKAWGFTGLLVLLYVINWGDKAVLGIVAQPLADELGLSASQIGLVGSAFFLTFTIGGFFAGLLHRMMTLKWSLVVLSLCWAAAMLPTVFAASFAVLLVSRMVLGFTEGPSSAMIHTGVYSWHAPERRGLPSACITAASSIAKIAVAPALALVVASWSWHAAFVVLAVVGVAWCAAWLPSWQEGPYGKQHSTSATDTTTPNVSWLRIFATPSFLGGAAAVFAMYAIASVVLTWLPSYFEVALGYSRVESGFLFGLPSIASLILMFVLTPLSDRLISRGSSSRLLRGVMPSIGLLICGLALVTIPFITSPWVAVAVVSVGYGCGATVLPLFNSAISEIVPARQLAGTLGVFLALMSTGGLLGPYLTGVTVEAATSPAEGYASAFQIFGIIAITGAVLALLTVNPERDRARLFGSSVDSAAIEGR